MPDTPVVIRVLPDVLISKIAAGEVVERPSSVVKETVENALDAGAQHVRVELEDGGCERIAVIDNGSGMSPGNLELAFSRHATSKIETFEDLERVGTLGFRGEALAAIASVARVEATSAVNQGEGAKLGIEGGEAREVQWVARPRGTTIEVRNLFYNVPARRKFLKRPSTEYRRALEVVQGYALAQPLVHFEVVHNRRETLNAPPCSEDMVGRQDRIRQLFGEALADHLVALRPDPIASGFVGDKETIRGRRTFLFVNGRLVRDRALLSIFYQGVRDLWHSDRFPTLFLFLDVPAHEVDVNVHPQKAEVRFRDRAILGQTGAALRHALEEARGEEPVLLRPVAEDSRPAGFAWSSLRDQKLGDGGGQSIADPSLPYQRSQGSGETLGSVNYRPWESRGVVLSGKKGDRRPLRVLGQYKGSLILVEGPDGLYLVDQHAAHERVLYEKFRSGLEQETVEVQTLLVPRILEVSPAEAETLEGIQSKLDGVGYQVSVLSGSSVSMSAVPAALREEDAERVLLSLAQEGGRDGLETPDRLKARLLDGLAADKACRSAVRIHYPLTQEKMEELLTQLFEADQPYSCPHGRPTILKLDDGEIERRFGRQGWNSGSRPMAL